jgi:hypothetical protein
LYICSNNTCPTLSTFWPIFWHGYILSWPVVSLLLRRAEALRECHYNEDSEEKWRCETKVIIVMIWVVRYWELSSERMKPHRLILARNSDCALPSSLIFKRSLWESPPFMSDVSVSEELTLELLKRVTITISITKVQEKKLYSRLGILLQSEWVYLLEPDTWRLLSKSHHSVNVPVNF